MIASNDISRAVTVLRSGGLVAFPTETVYGLGADALNENAIAKVYAAKDRPSFNPLIVHVASADEAFLLGRFDSVSQLLVRRFWPGPLTLVVPRAANCPVPLLASAGLDTIALRVPSHKLALELLRKFGKPVVAPSANPSGRISPTTMQHVRDGLGDKVDFIVDGGASDVGIESSVVRIVDGYAYLLRSGAIARCDVEAVLKHKLHDPETSRLHSPGQLESHYAPNAPLRLGAKSAGDGEIYIGFGAFSHGLLTLSATGDLVEAAANLYRLLHEADAQRPQGIAIAPIPSMGLGEAINDRLKRAAAPRTT